MKNAGGFLIGSGIALLVGYGIWYKFVRVAPTQDQNNGGGNGTNPDTTTNPKTNPPALPISYEGKKVSDVILNTDPKLLIGKKVYAAYDNTSVYTTLNTPYTKAKKGQLLGVYAGHTPAQSGGNMVNIKTSDPSNKYLVAFDGQLKF